MSQSSYCLFHGKTIAWRDLTPRRGSPTRKYRTKEERASDVESLKDKILKFMKAEKYYGKTDLMIEIDGSPHDFDYVLRGLLTDNLIERHFHGYCLPSHWSKQ